MNNKKKVNSRNENNEKYSLGENERYRPAENELTTNINITDISGKTAIHYAAMSHNLNLVTYLVEKGAIIDLSDKYGKLPLCYAKESQNPEIVHYLECKLNEIKPIDHPLKFKEKSWKKKSSEATVSEASTSTSSLPNSSTSTSSVSQLSESKQKTK